MTTGLSGRKTWRALWGRWALRGSRAPRRGERNLSRALTGHADLTLFAGASMVTVRTGREARRVVLEVVADHAAAALLDRDQLTLLRDHITAVLGDGASEAEPTELEGAQSPADACPGGVG